MIGRRLPHHLLYIDPPKLTHFLLNPNHPTKPDHALFLIARKFDPGNPDLLAHALRVHAAHNPVTGARRTSYGINYQVEAPMLLPDGSWHTMIVIWKDENIRLYELVTAYPR